MVLGITEKNGVPELSLIKSAITVFTTTEFNGDNNETGNRNFKNKTQVRRDDYILGSIGH